jgi:DNA polymerase III delta prime subunit
MNESSELLVYKYKPKSFTDFTNIPEIVQLLEKYMFHDKLHIMVIGPEGSGKTVLLDTIVKEYYAPYEKDVYINNILRINSLYEQGVNYLRTELKHFCQTCSVISTKKKMLIMDDIDILPELSQCIITTIIDKYKPKIHIVLSCNNIYKIISSIQSKIIMITLPEISNEYLKVLSLQIVTNYKLVIDEPSIDYIINSSNNNISKLLNYFEKILLFDSPINIQTTHTLCGSMNIRLFETYITYIQNNNLSMAIQQLYEIYDSGSSVIDIFDELFTFIKKCSLNDTHKYNIIQLISKYINIFYTFHEHELELAMFTNDMFKVIQDTNYDNSDAVNTSPPK